MYTQNSRNLLTLMFSLCSKFTLLCVVMIRDMYYDALFSNYILILNEVTDVTGTI